jgi:hypothetical protein
VLILIKEHDYFNHFSTYLKDFTGCRSSSAHLSPIVVALACLEESLNKPQREPKVSRFLESVVVFCVVSDDFS